MGGNGSLGKGPQLEEQNSNVCWCWSTHSHENQDLRKVWWNCCYENVPKYFSHLAEKKPYLGLGCCKFALKLLKVSELWRTQHLRIIDWMEILDSQKAAIFCSPSKLRLVQTHSKNAFFSQTRSPLAQTATRTVVLWHCMQRAKPNTPKKKAKNVLGGEKCIITYSTWETILTRRGKLLCLSKMRL